MAQHWNLSTKIWQKFFFLNSPSHFKMLCKKRLKTQVCSMWKFWIFRIFKHQRYLIFFGDSCKNFCYLKTFIDVATAQRHRGFSTVYYKHNLIHQGKLGKDVELQNTHIVFFKSPHDVMQVIMLRAQLGLELDLVGWYRDTKLVPLCRLLIGLSPRTDHRLWYCTSSGSVLSKFCIAEQLNHLKILDDKNKKLLYCPCVPTIFPQTQKPKPTDLPIRNIPVSTQMGSEFAQRKLTKRRKMSRGTKFRTKFACSPWMKNLQPLKRRSSVRAKLVTNSNPYFCHH